MGAMQFTTQITVSKSTSDQEAFNDARDGARHDNGHAGYTGTIAEKNDFIRLHTVSSKENAERLVSAYSGSGIPILRAEARDRVDDKWGPAGAIRFPVDAKTDGFIFFGWASS